MKMGSLFDGVAMFVLAAVRNGIKTVWASEIEKFPMAVSKHHFPDMKHLGDIQGISGADIEPVDIITFGSPCQDLSVAGKREGIAGERSGLFSEAIRIIREMQEETNEEYPRYAIWENVPGAFSSNKGQDFRTVLEEITASEIPMPKSGKWAKAGMVRGDGYSVAWRVCDAQYWGVPQRRKRIFLVADFRGQRAGEILFECESASGDTSESGETREEIAGSVGNGTKATVYGAGLSQKAEGIGFTDNLSTCVTPGTHPGHGNHVIQPITFRDTAGTLRANAGAPKHESDWEKLIVHQKPIAFNGRQDPVYGQVTGAIDTDRATQCVLHPKVTGTNCASGAGTNRPAGQGNETDLCIVFGPNGKNLSHCLCAKNSTGRLDPSNETMLAHALIGHGVYQQGVGTLRAKFGDCGGGSETLIAHAVDVRNLYETEELSGTLQSKNTGGYSLNYQNPVRVGYAVRRLTPLECERLMSMPDNWTNIPGASDTARYKAIGNSLVMYIPDWIFSQIVKEESNA